MSFAIKSQPLFLRILLLLASSLLGPGAFATPTCPPQTLREFIWGIESMHGPTLHVVRRLPGRFGGLRYEVRRKGFRLSNWSSTLPHDDAPQGSPLFLFSSLAPNVREFFGFQTLRKQGAGLVLKSQSGGVIDLPSRVSVPDSREFSGAIAAFNQIEGLDPDARIGISFYPSGGRVNELSYLRKWAQRGELPWGWQGSEFHHDAYYHAGAAVQMPQVLVEFSRRQITAWLEFRDLYLPLKAKQLTQSDDGQLILEKIDAQLARRIDIGLGVLPQHLDAIAEKQTHLPKSDQDTAFLKLRRMMVDGASPKELLENLDTLKVNLSDDRLQKLKKTADQIIMHYRAFSEVQLKHEPGFGVGLKQIQNDIWLENQILIRAQKVEQAIKAFDAGRSNVEKEKIRN